MKTLHATASRKRSHASLNRNSSPLIMNSLPITSHAPRFAVLEKPATRHASRHTASSIFNAYPHGRIVRSTDVFNLLVVFAAMVGACGVLFAG
jgi:hypothetical protein